jgi:Fe-S cluster assembly iron-binding protein IscA
MGNIGPGPLKQDDEPVPKLDQPEDAPKSAPIPRFRDPALRHDDCTTLAQEDGDMLDVTDAAREALHSAMLHSASEYPHQANLGFRLVASKEPDGRVALGLALDEANPGDQLVQYQERTVLLIDGIVAAAFDGRTLDLVQTEEGDQLKIL